MNQPAKQLLAASILLGFGASVFAVSSAYSSAFSGGAFGGQQIGTTGAPTFTSTQTDGGAAFVAPTGQRVCLDGATCSVYATYDGGTIGFVGAEPEGPHGLLRNNTAAEDAYANTFVATGFSADGGTGGYAFTCNGPTCKYKLAEGSQMDMVATGNDVSFNTSSFTITTGFSYAYACRSSQNCYLYADPGFWMYYVPTTDVTTGCAAGTAGGVKFKSTDSRLYNCDGTTSQRVAYSLSASASVDFASMADGAGDTQTLTVTGAATTDVVHCSPTGGTPEAGLVIRWARVSASNTVTIAAINLSGGALDPAALSYTCVVTR